MILLRSVWVCLLCFAAVAQAQEPLSNRLDQLIESAPDIQRGNIGYIVLDLNGDVLAKRNSSGFFAPASNTKLYTTALALMRLGANYTFQTELRTNGTWAPGQTGVADLELVGGGDPNLSGRVLPYSVSSDHGDPLGALKELADRVAATGIRRIDGDVVGVSTRYAGDPYPDGWTIDDSLYSYGAPVTALAVNDNAITLKVRPGDLGDLAAIAMDPPLPHFVVLNQIVTDNSDATQIHVWRPIGSSELILSGSIGARAGEWREDLAMDDPALYSAEALIDMLRDRGILVRGGPRARYCRTVTTSDCDDRSVRTVLAVHQSAPLSQVIQVVNKVSQNLHAEMLLREVGRVSGGSGTLEAGIAQRQAFLPEIGVTPEISGAALEDGSGLARQDLTTPEATAALLEYMWLQPVRDVWLESLPIGGVDGSLQHRFANVPGSDGIHAKTGSYAHVNTLSGYVETVGGNWLVFSIMVNATVAPEDTVHNFIDAFCQELLRE